MIDFNKLDTGMEKSFKSKVHYVIDHHADHHKYLDSLIEKKMLKCGSATTLIVSKLLSETEVFRDKEQPEGEISRLALFSMAPLTLDTLNF